MKISEYKKIYVRIEEPENREIKYPDFVFRYKPEEKFDRKNKTRKIDESMLLRNIRNRHF